MKNRLIIACGVLVVWSASLAHAANRAQIRGVVLSAGGDPVAEAVVSVPEVRRETTTDEMGRFLIEELAQNEYLVSVSSLRFGGAVLRIVATDDPGAEVEIQLDKTVHSGAISVTAAGVVRSLAELTTPVDILAGEDLQLRKQSTLGETLAQQPGVTATTYGQGSSRPVIRGLGEDRIRILENGLDTGDVSSCEARRRCCGAPTPSVESSTCSMVGSRTGRHHSR